MATGARLVTSTLALGVWPTELLAWRVEHPVLQLLVVPGNPGLASAYITFCEHLSAAFGGAADVLALSHVGHDAAGLAGGRIFDLNEQVKHKEALLREVVLAPGRPPAVLLGHSIGAYMLLRALQRLEDAAPAHELSHLHTRLPRIVLLMPFLSCDWASTKQRTLRVASHAAPLLGALAGSIGGLPHSLQNMLLQVALPGAEPHAATALKALMTRQGAHNYMYLAWHEFRDLDQPPHWHLIRRLQQRVATVCVPDDVWFPRRHYDQMRAALPDSQELWRRDLTHAFCLWSGQCSRAAALVRELADSVLVAQLGAKRPSSGPLSSGALLPPGTDSTALAGRCRKADSGLDTDSAAAAAAAAEAAAHASAAGSDGCSTLTATARL